MRPGRRILTGTVGFVFAMAAAACMRLEHRTEQLRVPDMATARDIRIVTNAALNEAIGRYDGIRNEAEVEVARGLVLYHESSRLLSEAYRRRLLDGLREVGYEARYLSVGHNPPFTLYHELQNWPDRYTAVLQVPALRSNRDANIVLDAIAHARTGDHPAVTTDSRARTRRVAYNPRHLARRNLEVAVASAGYAVNDTPALLGRPDAPALHWMPVTMQ